MGVRTFFFFCARGFLLAICVALTVAAATESARARTVCTVLLPGSGHFLSGVPGGWLFAAIACALSVAAPATLTGFDSVWAGDPEVESRIEGLMAVGFIFVAGALGLAAAVHFKRRSV